MRFSACPSCQGSFKTAARLVREGDDGRTTCYHHWFSCRSCGRTFYSLAVEDLAREAIDFAVNLVDPAIWKRDVKIARRQGRKPVVPGSEIDRFLASLGYGEYIFTDYS